MTTEILHGDCIEQMTSLIERGVMVDSIVTDPPAGIAFMGKEWDHHKGGRDQWIAWMEGVAAKALILAKPGAHALVWALPKTSHWTVTAWENAGWEVRDRVSHLFGTGFPKSLDIYKAIAKSSVPEQSEKWEGWGTALKPAMEDWWLLRKPLSEKTVAANVLKHGTGGLNIDDCRIHNTGENNRDNKGGCLGYSGGKPTNMPYNSTGRFPSHLIHDGSEEVMEAFAKFGERKNGGPNYKGGDRNSVFGNTKVVNPTKYAGQSGTADRFFYCAKASKTDRFDSKHPTIKSIALLRYLCKLITPPGGTILDMFAGSGTTLAAAHTEGFHSIGIEKEDEYIDDIRRRVAFYEKAIVSELLL